MGGSPDHPLSNDRFHHYLTTQADGNVARITFTFDFYLKFVNWGVWKGGSIDNRDTLVLSGSITRQRKPWCDVVFPKQLT